MEIRWDEIPSNFNKITFDTFTDSWNDIEIRICNNEQNCYIIQKDNKLNLIERFKLSNQPRVNIFCTWTFFKSSKTGKFLPRPTFYKLNENSEYPETSKQKVNLALDNGDIPVKFWDMINFLQGYRDLIDIGEFENKYKVINKEDFIQEFNNYDAKEQISTLQAFIGDNNLSYEQLEQLLENSKRKSLEEFKELLDKNDISESTWQHFFEENMWIFAGISLKLFFINGIIPQANIGIPNALGQGSPEVDILGINDYTTLVELKTPNTPIFTETKRNTARTNTWSFSPEFIDGISQCLGQKENLIENKNKILKDPSGNIINGSTQDPKSIFIIGNKKKEFPNVLRKENDKIKADTFERYRRNSKNIDIITYDELYERAYYIVNGKN